MFETNLTIIGNVITDPETRSIDSGVSVTTFRIASTSRWRDRTEQRWVDGDKVFLRVVCWGALGQNVAGSVRKGEPVIVSGRLRTDSYETPSGERRMAFELRAEGVGHNLARGVSRFSRQSAMPPDHEVTGEAPGSSSGAEAAGAGAGEAVVGEQERRSDDLGDSEDRDVREEELVGA